MRDYWFRQIRSTEYEPFYILFVDGLATSSSYNCEDVRLLAERIKMKDDPSARVTIKRVETKAILFEMVEDEEEEEGRGK